VLIREIRVKGIKASQGESSLLKPNQGKNNNHFLF